MYYSLINSMSKTPSVDADVLLFITAASITDTTQKSAINKLVLDLKSASIWTKMKAIYPFVGGTAAKHRFNLKSPGTTAGDFYLTFYGGDTHSVNGYKPSGTNGYSDSQLIPSNVLSLNSNGIGYYATESTTSLGDPIQMGANNSGTQSLILASKSTTMFGGANGTNINNSISGGAGLFSVHRTSSTVTTIYKNNTTINSGNSGGTLPSTFIYIGTISVNSVPYTSGYVNSEFRFAYISDGLNSTEINSLYTAVQAYQTTLGRNI